MTVQALLSPLELLPVDFLHACPQLVLLRFSLQGLLRWPAAHCTRGRCPQPDATSASVVTVGPAQAWHSCPPTCFARWVPAAGLRPHPLALVLGPAVVRPSWPLRPFSLPSSPSAPLSSPSSAFSLSHYSLLMPKAPACLHLCSCPTCPSVLPVSTLGFHLGAWKYMGALCLVVVLLLTVRCHAWSGLSHGG